MERNEHVDRSRAAYAGAPVRDGMYDYAWSSDGASEIMLICSNVRATGPCRDTPFLIRRSSLECDGGFETVTGQNS